MGQILLVLGKHCHVRLHFLGKLHFFLVLLMELSVKELLSTLHVEFGQSSLLTGSLVLVMLELLHFDGLLGLWNSLLFVLVQRLNSNLEPFQGVRLEVGSLEERLGVVLSVKLILNSHFLALVDVLCQHRVKGILLINKIFHFSVIHFDSEALFNSPLILWEQTDSKSRGQNNIRPLSLLLEIYLLEDLLIGDACGGLVWLLLCLHCVLLVTFNINFTRVLLPSVVYLLLVRLELRSHKPVAGKVRVHFLAHVVWQLQELVFI